MRMICECDVIERNFVSVEPRAHQGQRGLTVWFTGLSGAGKSTVINLLCKFYLPNSGEILLDNVNLNDYDNTFLRNDLGLVLQKNHIFQGSIEDNIRYGNMNATFEEIEEAAEPVKE